MCRYLPKYPVLLMVYEARYLAERTLRAADWDVLRALLHLVISTSSDGFENFSFKQIYICMDSGFHETRLVEAEDHIIRLLHRSGYNTQAVH